MMDFHQMDDELFENDRSAGTWYVRNMLGLTSEWISCLTIERTHYLTMRMTMIEDFFIVSEHLCRLWVLTLLNRLSQTSSKTRLQEVNVPEMVIQYHITTRLGIA